MWTLAGYSPRLSSSQWFLYRGGSFKSESIERLLSSKPESRWTIQLLCQLPKGQEGAGFKGHALEESQSLNMLDFHIYVQGHVGTETARAKKIMNFQLLLENFSPVSNKSLEEGNKLFNAEKESCRLNNRISEKIWIIQEQNHFSQGVLLTSYFEGTGLGMWE